MRLLSNSKLVYLFISAVGSLKKVYSIVLDYSLKRKVLGKPMVELPAH
jgi:hypothetical protein